MDVTKSKYRHDTCVHAEACDRAYTIHGRWYEGKAEWMGCDRCNAYDSQHCPMAYAGTMRCRGLA